MTDQVPAHIRGIVAILGEEKAVEFFLEFGGAEVYWPIDAKGNSEMAELFGISAARKLGKRANDEGWPSRVPIPKKWLASVLLKKGLPVARIARKLHTSDATIRRMTKPDRDRDQPSLFPDD